MKLFIKKFNNLLSCIIAFAQIVVRATLAHVALYILYMAVAGNSILNGALMRPTVDGFITFGSELLMVYLAIMSAIVLAFSIVSDAYKWLSAGIKSLLVVMLTYLLLPGFNRIHIVMFLVCLFIIIVYPRIRPAQYDCLDDSDFNTVSRNLQEINKDNHPDIDVEYVENILKAKYGEVERVSQEELSKIMNDSDGEDDGLQ